MKTLGPPAQVGYVVTDMQEAAQFWTKLGAGPIYILRLDVMGKLKNKVVSYTVDLGLGYWGDLQIELIKQVTAGPSPYSDWDGSFQTLHHIGIISTDSVADARRLEAEGYPVVFDATAPFGYISYHEKVDQPTGMIELLPAPLFETERFKAIKAASLNWDGRNPIRDESQLPAWDASTTI